MGLFTRILLLSLLTTSTLTNSEEKEDEDELSSVKRARNICKLFDRSLTRVTVFKESICYFTVANATTEISKYMDEERIYKAAKLCAKHNGAHLPRIRSVEEAKFILRNFFEFQFDREILGRDVKKILLGLHGAKGEYHWDDNTHLTYVPRAWNNYYDRVFYVYMHTYSLEYEFNVIWSTGGAVWNTSDPVGIVCQMEVGENTGSTEVPGFAVSRIDMPSTDTSSVAVSGHMLSGGVHCAVLGLIASWMI